MVPRGGHGGTAPTETAPDTEISGENSSGSPTDIPGVASPDITTYQLTWRDTGRAKSPRPLKPLKLLEFRIQAVASAIALFFLARFILQFLLSNTKKIGRAHV